MIAPKRLPVTERLHNLLYYDENTGCFTWRVKRHGTAAQGSVAGTVDHNGYRRIFVDGRVYAAHRLAWKYVTGEEPSFHIDHKDGDRDNNSFRNLRKTEHGENHQNTSLYKNSSTGFRGVTQRGIRFYAHIRVGKKRIHLGCFGTAEAAHDAYLAAKAKLHEFQPVPRDIAA